MIQTEYLFVFFQLLVAVGFVLFSLSASHLKDWFFPKIQTKAKAQAFESGIKSYGNARSAFSVKYFVVAILFVLLDVEIIFMYPWILIFKELGWEAFYKMLVFISLFIIVFFYIVKKGALKWNS